MRQKSERTNNEIMWSSEFGNDYTKRQKKDLKGRYEFFDKALFEVAEVEKCNTVCEFGANIGENIRTLEKLFKVYSPAEKMEFSAIEINKKCCDKLSEYAFVYNQSVEKPIKEKFDLVFTRGLLIHLEKEVLDKAIKNIYNSSNKYILIAEYITPERRMVEYRGKKDMMWTDDYFKPLIKKGCELIDCGFDYKYFITWALLLKGGKNGKR